MTKEQAREYATRIRLGDPPYWGTKHGLNAAAFRDGTLIAIRVGEYGTNKPVWELATGRAAMSPTAARLIMSCPDILALLDERAR
jgi:hypothetical protein